MRILNRTTPFLNSRGLTTGSMVLLRKLIFLLIVATPAWSATTAQILQTKLNTIHTMCADFNQTIRSKQREMSHSSGTMALDRPGHFRWQTSKPLDQWLIADGKHVWVYDVDLEQVTVKPQDLELGGAAGLFLNGYNSKNTIEKEFEVTFSRQKSLELYDLKAKSDKASFQRMKLGFINEQLIQIELFDQLGQHTEIHFSHIQTNIVLSKLLFQFKPPQDVDVVEQ